MKKKILLSLLFLLPLGLAAQKWNDARYLRGAVPVNAQGVVCFTETIDVPGKRAPELLTALRRYAEEKLLAGPDAIREGCRIIDDEADGGTFAVRMDEYLYFKRTAWVLHRTRFLYDLIFHVSDGSVRVEMQHLRYLYNPQEVEGAEPERRSAEDWITDSEALSPKGRLLKKTRQFRVFTIDRKDQIFRDLRAALLSI
ncbi:MAG: DUF4468 domain-containing protein [Alloprevotella sp.]|nr:DUF4468 domain-containing protein [Alloprevotella sp.]